MKYNINFLKLGPFFAIVSLVLVLFSLFEMSPLGRGFNFGTDFKGGVEVTASIKAEATVADLDAALSENGLSCDIQPVVAETPRFFIRTTIKEEEGQSEAEALNALEVLIKSVVVDKYGEENVTFDEVRAIGGTISSENRDKAFSIIFWVMVAIILYLTFRFKFVYGLGAIIAVVHDVIIMLGVLVLTGTEINVFTITAALTIFGYSVNDTIILFDRVREFANEKKWLDYNEMVNMSINSVLSRTLITSLTTLFVVVSLLMNSQGALHDFSLALTVGLITGTYSSIYVAANFVTFWNKYRPITEEAK